MAKMKIAHINGVYGYGSTGRLISEIVRYGEEMGVESRVFYSEKKSDKPEAVRYISNIERYAHAVASRITGLQGYWSFAATGRLIKYLKNYSPDIVHLHVLHGNSICLKKLMKYLARNNIPVVITLHDCWWFTGGCSHPLEYGCEKWKACKTNPCKKCQSKGDVCPVWIERQSHKTVTDRKVWLSLIDKLYVVGVSKWLLSEVNQSYVFSQNEHNELIYNWIDTTTFAPNECEEHSAKEKKVILGVASIFTENKGIEDFIWLSKNLSEDYRIVLIGKIPYDIALPSNISHINSTNNINELAYWYNEAAVFVNPSKYETFGLTTVEAISCGTPVVVYDVTANSEIVSKEVGECVPYGDREKMLEAIIHVSEMTVNADELHRYVCNHFEQEKQIQKYYDLYGQIYNYK